MDLYLILSLLFILFIIIYIYILKTVSLKQKSSNKNDILEENKEFILYSSRIKNKIKYYVSINNYNNELFLTPNKNLACKFKLEESLNNFVLKANNFFIAYEYPLTYKNIYNITLEKDTLFNTLLKIKYIKNGFLIQFENSHYIVYNPSTLRLHSTKKSSKQYKKILFKIKNI